MKKKPLFASALAAVFLVNSAQAQTTWDGGGGATTSWGTNSNWDNDILPAFNGADSLSVTSGFGVNTAMTLGADRSIGRLTFGGGGTAISLSGNTLRLNSTTTAAGTGTALWNAATADNATATVNSNILLQSGSPGSYTGHFRENNNASGGTRFNGTITQGAGENWTMRFSQNSARGNWFLNNASNSIFAIRNDGTNLFSEIAGAFGGASLTLSGGVTGTRLTDHYTTAVNNSITLTTASTFGSQIQTRLTGSMTQGANALSYGFASNGSTGNGVMTRLEYSSFSGTGTTALIGGALSTSSLSNLATGTLNLGSSSSASGVLVLSGSSGNGVPTWSDFATAKTYNQAGGANTWRIDAGTAGNNTGSFGGFAAKDADLLIPATGGGLSDQTFARNFALGSSATFNGNQYATNTVNIQTDIAYGSVAGANRYFQVAPNQGTSKTSTVLTLAGPVHELSGTITGDSVIMYPMGSSNSTFGLVRISNASNSLTGTSRWIIGGTRGAFTSMGGGTIGAPGNMGDLSSLVAIFTSDSAFGGATEVQVSSRSSSGTSTTGTLLFEDTNGAGNTTFTRNINVWNDSQSTGPAAWGSYAGDVVYTGTATLGGTVTGSNDDIIHVQAGTMSLGVAGGSAATITNNRTSGTTHDKSGAGTLLINNLTVNGTQATNNWNVREGTLGGVGSVGGTVVVSAAATLAPGMSTGTFDIGGALTLSSASNLNIELGGATPGDGNTFYDQVNVTGNGIITGSNLNLSLANGYAPLDVDVFYILTLGGSRTGTFSGLAEGDAVTVGAYTGNITYAAAWTGTQGGSFLTGGNDVAIYGLVIPEPGTVLLLTLGFGVMVFGRRRV